MMCKRIQHIIVGLVAMAMLYFGHAEAQTGTVRSPDAAANLSTSGNQRTGLKFGTFATIVTADPKVSLAAMRRYWIGLNDPKIKVVSYDENRLSIIVRQVAGNNSEKEVVTIATLDQLDANSALLDIDLRLSPWLVAKNVDIIEEFNNVIAAAQSVAKKPLKSNGDVPGGIPQPHDKIRSVVVSSADEKNKPLNVEQNPAPIIKSPFGITAHIEDDPAKGESILGNSDGRIQPGEAFDLVVVLTNTGNVEVKGVECTVTLPADKSVKAFSKLRQTVTTLALGATSSFRYNFAVPMSVDLVQAVVCSIEVKESGSQIVERWCYELPMDFP
jgi:hypothetical protein